MKYDSIDLLTIVVEDGEENSMFEWVKVSTLDDKFGRPDPEITQANEKLGIDVNEVLSSKVGVDSGEKSSFDSLMRGSTHEGTFRDFGGLYDSET